MRSERCTRRSVLAVGRDIFERKRERKWEESARCLLPPGVCDSFARLCASISGQCTKKRRPVSPSFFFPFSFSFFRPGVSSDFFLSLSLSPPLSLARSLFLSLFLSLYLSLFLSLSLSPFLSRDKTRRAEAIGGRGARVSETRETRSVSQISVG